MTLSSQTYGQISVPVFGIHLHYSLCVLKKIVTKSAWVHLYYAAPTVEQHNITHMRGWNTCNYIDQAKWAQGNCHSCSHRQNQLWRPISRRSWHSNRQEYTMYKSLECSNLGYDVECCKAYAISCRRPQTMHSWPFHWYLNHFVCGSAYSVPNMLRL